jgi:hypothetical protein
MFRLPNINGQTDSHKVRQIAEFLFQFIRELNIKVEQIEKDIELLKNNDETKKGG